MAERDSRQKSHPDLAELDAFRTGEASPETARHVEQCLACRAVFSDIQALAGEIAKADAEPDDAPEMDIPEAVDRRMLMLARTRAAEVRAGIDRAKRRRRFLTPLRVASGAVAAAAVVVAAGVFTMTGMRTPAPMAESTPQPAADAGPSIAQGDAMDVVMDIDSSGTIDIVDAYLMSRRLKRGAAPSSWDFDDDGAVTDTDVDVVVSRAVAHVDLDGGI
ncbi:MAG: hypothetical protein ACYTKD_01660 [Planctomycetota bacterium]